MAPFPPWLRLSYAHSFSQWIDIMHIAFHNKKADFLHIFFQSIFMLRTNFCTCDWKFFLFLAFPKFMYFLDCIFFIFFQWCTSNNFGCKTLGGRPDGCRHQIGVEPAPVKLSVVWFLCKQTQQRPPRFSSCRYLSDISTGARNLVRTVCTFPLWRNVRGFGLSSPRFIVVVSFSPMWYSAAIMAIICCNSLRACFLTSMKQEMLFKCNIYFNELDLNFLWMLKCWRATPSGVSSSRSGVVFRFISNSIKLKCKATLVVHKRRNKSYVFSVVCVINLIEWKCIYLLLIGYFNPCFWFTWRKTRFSVVGLHCLLSNKKENCHAFLPFQ